MTEQQVIQLMESSKSEEEWNDNAQRVKEEFNGMYPSFWFAAIILSGVAKRTASKFGQSADINTSVIKKRVHSD